MAHLPGADAELFRRASAARPAREEVQLRAASSVSFVSAQCAEAFSALSPINKQAAVSTSASAPSLSAGLCWAPSASGSSAVLVTVPGSGSPSGRCDEASLSAGLCWPPSVSRSSALRLQIERGARDGAKYGFALWSVR